MSSLSPDQSDALAVILDYHQRTKHRFEAYARSPGTLDWDEQPAPFRHFADTQQIRLPLLDELPADSRIRLAVQRPFASLSQPWPAAPVDLASLGALLQLSLGLSAWKSLGPDRWAVRANPSSGNLHPAEAYLLLHGVEGLANGLYHYRPEQHSLELRAAHPDADGTPRLAVILTSVMWREAWKYGERAFRYCQLDCGHASAAVRMAAACLGWSAQEQPQLASQALAAVCGTDRLADFPARKRAETEVEEAELLLTFGPERSGIGEQALLQLAGNADWHGTASSIDRHPMYSWPVIGQVAAATREPGRARLPAPALPTGSDSTDCVQPAAGLLLNRRSAQRFDHQYQMPQTAFRQLLTSLQPAACAPWDVLEQPAGISLLLFVHRVEGLAPGLYLLLRDAVQGPTLLAELGPRFACNPVPGCPQLYLLDAMEPVPLARTARSLHCHQELGATAALAIGMLCPFEPLLQKIPASYRRLLRECGLTGQQLYLQAEALGLRGTGIGCFFDDPVHELLGLDGLRWQSLYHFTLGLPVVDPRIESTPAYASRTPSP